LGEQDLERICQVTYTNREGEIERVEFHYPRTLKDAERQAPKLKKWGLEMRVSPIDDDALIKTLIDLSGMKSCEPSELHFSVIFDIIHDKVINLTKPRSKVKSKRTGLKSRIISEKKPEKVFELKPRRKGQTP
jgi:hypothetical protein